jgi:hypothetical protein
LRFVSAISAPIPPASRGTTPLSHHTRPPSARGSTGGVCAGAFQFVYECDVSRLLFYGCVTSSYMNSEIQCKYAQKTQSVKSPAGRCVPSDRCPVAHRCPMHAQASVRDPPSVWRTYRRYASGRGPSGPPSPSASQGWRHSPG